MKNFFIILGLVPLTATASFAQYYQQPQYNPPSFFSPGGGAAPVVVPPAGTEIDFYANNTNHTI